MVDIPLGIKTAYERLRVQYPFYISLNRLNGKYYVYKQSSKYNSETKDYKTVSEYLGRITEGGVFIKKGFRSNMSLEQANEIIKLNGGQVIMPGVSSIPESRREAAASQEDELDEDDKKILTALSMNGRIEIPYMKKIMGIKSNNIRYRIERLEKKYGIKYLAVLEPEILGYKEHVAFIKFKDKMPKVEEIRTTLEKNPYVQFAILTNGKYDLFIYFLTEKSYLKDYLKEADIMYSIKMTLFPDYDIETFNMSHFYRTYGYIPLRDLFFEKVLKKNVWHRTKINPQPKEYEITNSCLLYTSPSPRDAHESRMPSSA